MSKIIVRRGVLEKCHTLCEPKEQRNVPRWGVERAKAREDEGMVTLCKKPLLAECILDLVGGDQVALMQHLERISRLRWSMKYKAHRAK